MKKYVLLLLCLFAWSAQAKIYDVTRYGATGNGHTIDTPAINQAILEAAAQGGGTVYFPAGEYACYSIRLASHVHLYLEQGATIVAAFPTATDGYDEAEPNEHGVCAGLVRAGFPAVAGERVVGRGLLAWAHGMAPDGMGR